MTTEDRESKERRRLIVSNHRKRNLGTWLVPLVIILVVIYFLPRLAEMLN